MCATQHLPSASSLLAGWPMEGGGERRSAATPIIRLGSHSVTTWPALLGWLSGPAGATLDGRLAGLGRVVRIANRVNLAIRAESRGAQ